MKGQGRRENSDKNNKKRIEKKEGEKGGKIMKIAGKFCSSRNFRFLRLVWISLSPILLPKYLICMLG